MRRIPILFWCVLCAAASVPPARGDILHLSGGGLLEGRVTREGEGYRIVTRHGSSVIPSAQVVRLETRPLPEDEYAERAGTLAADDAMGHYALGLWCRQNNLSDQAKTHFETAVRLDPSLEGAWRAMGFLRDGSEWIAPAEYHRRRGEALFDGQWIPLAEAMRRERQRETAAKSARALDEGWPIVVAYARNHGTQDANAVAARLAEYGEGALPLLRRASMERRLPVRRLVILTAARLPERGATDLLLDRLVGETSTDLAVEAAHALAQRPDRNQVANLLMTCIMQSVGRSREVIRGSYGLSVLGDAGVIPALIENIEYSPDVPVAKSAQRAEASGGMTGFDGKEMSVSSSLDGAGPSLSKRYPAQLALKLLTQQDLPPDKVKWTAWWDGAKAEFRLSEKQELLSIRSLDTEAPGPRH